MEIETKKRTWLEAFGILGLGVAFMLAWAQCHAQAERAQECESNLAAVTEARKAPLDKEHLRVAMWEAMHPCGMSSWMVYPFEGVPTPARCKEFRAKMEQAEIERKTQVSLWDMMQCARSGRGYQEEAIADSVTLPYVHYSWVLGGDCETLAHKLKNREKNPLCVDFVDDDHESAERCRQEVAARVRGRCSEDDPDDKTRRLCLTRLP